MGCDEALAQFFVCNVVVVRIMRAKCFAILRNAMEINETVHLLYKLSMPLILLVESIRKCLVRTVAAPQVSSAYVRKGTLLLSFQ